MIKKILVALDPDSDTAVATRHAIEMAGRFGAQITGLAVIDSGSIASSSRGGGIGSMYYAERLKERLTEEARDSGHALVRQFATIVQKAGIPHSELMQEGVPFRRIVEDMKYHDLLIVGKEPHFFYSHPKEATETLARVVKKTVGPTLIVTTPYRAVRRVLIAYDGSQASARAMRSFARSQPFGTDVDVRIVSIYESNESETELSLSMAADYLRAHGFTPTTAALRDDNITDVIVSQIDNHNIDLVVAGAHAKSRIRSVAFGSTTSFLVKNCPVALFLDN